MQSYPVSPLDSGNNDASNVSAFSPTPFVDLGQRRSADNGGADKNGTSFLMSRGENPPRKGKRSFFRDVESEEQSPGQITKDFLIKTIQNLAPQQCYNIAMELQVTPPTRQTLLNYADSISSANINALNQILNLTQKQNYMQFKRFETSPEMLYDCRYTITDHPPILQEARVGQSPVNINFEIPQLPPDIHVIIQSISTDTNQRSIYWPKTLVVLVNGIVVKNRGTYLLPFIDITKFATSGTVSLFCDQEAFPFILSAVQARYTTYKTLIETIRNRPDTHTSPESAPVDQCLIDPISGKLMEYPGRGISCMHSQCFDLKEYIKNANASHQWICPICKMSLPIQNLVFSHQTTSLLYAVTGKQEPIFNATQVFDDGFIESL